jgi:hypothetical protein
MAVSRRKAIKTIGAVAATPVFRLPRPEPGREHAEHLDVDAVLPAIAEIVLPAEADRTAAVAAFTRWIQNYREGADTDHGYGNTRVRATGASPARSYPAQIAALDAAAKARGAASFAAAPREDRTAVLEAAIADAKVERLSARPTGAHIATDLMGHFFNSSPGADLCYRAAIGRDVCRGLPGSDKPPAPLAPRASRAPQAPRA